ncbi:MAG: hypothetical protein JWM80_193 [Cyanobacteria bacterium RYN_339]|nr:hypothetical protein [Cyanobacteria bacterium RYN_339]
MKLLLPLLLAVTLSGCFLMPKPKLFPDKTDIAQNKAVYREGVVLHLAIESYMAAHQEAAPLPDEWIRVLTPKLPGGVFPANPWSGKPQADVVHFSTCPDLGAAYDEPTAVGTVLGPGVMPGGGPPTCRTYGTFMFTATHGGLRYFLYGIGRDGNNAVVRFLAQPTGNCCE